MVTTTERKGFWYRKGSQIEDFTILIERSGHYGLFLFSNGGKYCFNLLNIELIDAPKQQGQLTLFEP